MLLLLLCFAFGFFFQRANDKWYAKYEQRCGAEVLINYGKINSNINEMQVMMESSGKLH